MAWFKLAMKWFQYQPLILYLITYAVSIRPSCKDWRILFKAADSWNIWWFCSHFPQDCISFLGCPIWAVKWAGLKEMRRGRRGRGEDFVCCDDDMKSLIDVLTLLQVLWRGGGKWQHWTQVERICQPLPHSYVCPCWHAQAARRPPAPLPLSLISQAASHNNYSSELSSPGRCPQPHQRRLSSSEEEALWNPSLVLLKWTLQLTRYATELRT